MIRIYCDQRKLVDKLKALSEHIFRCYAVRIGIIGIKCKDASLKSIHDVSVGCLHDNVTYKPRTKLLK